MGFEVRVDMRKTIFEAYCKTDCLLSDVCPLCVSAKKNRRVSTVDVCGPSLKNCWLGNAVPDLRVETTTGTGCMRPLTSLTNNS